ncbi:MAG: DUF2024 family protein [Gammaproteobacteria bacterium]
MKQLHVFDTYAKSTGGRILHFDVILAEPDQQRAVDSARHWLEFLGEKDARVSSETCCFCHTTSANPEVQQEVHERGFAIYPLEGCPRPIEARPGQLFAAANLNP